jgi:hypothetical protein
MASLQKHHVQFITPIYMCDLMSLKPCLQCHNIKKFISLIHIWSNQPHGGGG